MEKYNILNGNGTLTRDMKISFLNEIIANGLINIIDSLAVEDKDVLRYDYISVLREHYYDKDHDLIKDREVFRNKLRFNKNENFISSYSPPTNFIGMCQNKLTLPLGLKFGMSFSEANRMFGNKLQLYTFRDFRGDLSDNFEYYAIQRSEVNRSYCLGFLQSDKTLVYLRVVYSEPYS